MLDCLKRFPAPDHQEHPFARPPCCIKFGLSAPAYRTAPRHLLALRGIHARGSRVPTARPARPTTTSALCNFAPESHWTAPCHAATRDTQQRNGRLCLYSHSVRGPAFPASTVCYQASASQLAVASRQTDSTVSTRSLRLPTFHSLPKKISRHHVSRQDDAIQAGGAGRRRRWQDCLDHPGMKTPLS